MGNISSWLNKDCFLFFGATDTDEDPMQVALIGLDSAGKTTMLLKTQYKRVLETKPTGINTELITVGKNQLLVVDLAGQTKLRAVWKHYIRNMQGCIFMVDIADSDRYDIAAKELHTVLEEVKSPSFVVLILFNKTDLVEGQFLDPDLVMKFKPLNPKTIHKFGFCSVTTNDLHLQELEWFTRTIKDQQFRQEHA
jgi:small GTP-binding protein